MKNNSLSNDSLSSDDLHALNVLLHTIKGINIVSTAPYVPQLEQAE